MSPADPPDGKPPDEIPDSSANSDSPEQSESPDSDSAESDRAGKWILTEEALNKLLACFAPDREEAGRQLNLMQAKLLRYWERRRTSPEDLIQETTDRVTRKIDQGENIFNLRAYFFSVSKLVSIEPAWRDDSKFLSLDEHHDIPDEPPPVDILKEARLSCLDECLAQLSAEERKLIVDYYTDMKRAKIDRRRELAEESTLNALRIRTCRIRKRLEKCVNECLKLSSDSK